MPEYPREEFDRSWWMATNLPGRLTAFDFAVLKSFSAEHFERARLLHTASTRPVLPPVSPPDEAAPLQTKSAPPPTGVSHEELRKAFASYDKDLCDQVIEVLKKMKSEAQTQIDALEQRVAAQSARLLELEALVASLTVPHGEH
jgi:hypothetical protein